MWLSGTSSYIRNIMKRFYKRTPPPPNGGPPPLSGEAFLKIDLCAAIKIPLTNHMKSVTLK